MNKIVKRPKEEMISEHRKTALEIPEGSVVSKRVLDARDKAQEIVNAAEAESSSMIKKAEKRTIEVENIRKKAHEEGLAMGREEGLATVTEQVVELSTMKEAFYEEAEQEIVKLVMAISEKVIGKMVSEHPGVVADVVRQALEHALGDRIIIRVNPEDYQALVAQKMDIRDELHRTKRLIFKEDESVTRGGCIVDTEVGTIDAQLEIQLAAIRKALGL